MITWPFWREKTGTWTPECLARADLIGWDPEVSQNWSSKIRSGIVHHKSDRKSCVIPTADRNKVDITVCEARGQLSSRKEISCNHKSTWICRLFLNYCYESSLIFFPRRDKYILNLLCVWCIGGKRQASFVVSLYCQAMGSLIGTSVLSRARCICLSRVMNNYSVCNYCNLSWYMAMMGRFVAGYSPFSHETDLIMHECEQACR